MSWYYEKEYKQAELHLGLLQKKYPALRVASIPHVVQLSIDGEHWYNMGTRDVIGKWSLADIELYVLAWFPSLKIVETDVVQKKEEEPFMMADSEAQKKGFTFGNALASVFQINPIASNGALFNLAFDYAELFQMQGSNIKAWAGGFMSAFTPQEQKKQIESNVKSLLDE